MLRFKTLFLACLYSALLALQPLTAKAELNAAPLGIFQVYQQNRAQGIPHYITVDLWLSAYSLLRQSSWQNHEAKVLLPALTQLSQSLLTISNQQPKDSAGDANRDLAAIVQHLLNPEAPMTLSPRAKVEWQLITQANGLHSSPLWEYPIDYSQFQVRGYYQQSPDLSRYFKAFRYLANIAWYINPSESTQVTTELANRFLQQSRYLLASAASSGDFTQTLDTLTSSLQWQFGIADDLRFDELSRLAVKTQAKSLEQWRQQLNAYAQKQQRLPQLRSGLISEPISPLASLAWRLLPLSLDQDQLALQTVLHPNTGVFNGTTDKPPFSLLTLNGHLLKGFPSVYELAMWQMGTTGQAWLSQWQENQYANYAHFQALAKQQLQQVTGLQKPQQAVFNRLLQTETAEHKIRLSAALAFWSWQRYIALLYHKPSYGLLGKGTMANKPRNGARIEAAPEIYQALLDLVAEHQQHDADPHWDSFSRLLKQAMHIAALPKQTNPQQQQFLNELDLQLTQLSGKTDKPLVMDIFTEPNSGQVVTEAIGFADIAFKDQARGARLSHYEFKQPLSQRLTDSQWQQRLNDAFVELSAVKTSTFITQ